MSELVPFIGYLASVLLAISLVVNNDLKFRWINSGGNISFLIYGLFIQAYPIILTNGTLLLINIYYLIKIHNTKEDFEMVEFKNDDQLIAKFLSFYKKDIQKYFPQFIAIQPADEIKFAILRDMVIANVFVAKLLQGGLAAVNINYTVPKYRDYQVGRFIFDKSKTLLEQRGVKEIIYRQSIYKKHQEFLKVMGFYETVMDGNKVYIKDLGS